MSDGDEMDFPRMFAGYWIVFLMLAKDGRPTIEAVRESLDTETLQAFAAFAAEFPEEKGASEEEKASLEKLRDLGVLAAEAATLPEKGDGTHADWRDRVMCFSRNAIAKNDLARSLQHPLLSDDKMQRIKELVAKRKAANITRVELDELEVMSADLEEKNASRLEAAARLAKLRGATLRDVLAEFDIRPLSLDA